MSTDAPGQVVITVCPDGPLLVRGPITLLDADDRPIDPRRRTVALCRCGKSGIRPFCDGSHRHGFRCPGVDARPAQGADVRSAAGDGVGPIAGDDVR